MHFWEKEQIFEKKKKTIMNRNVNVPNSHSFFSMHLHVSCTNKDVRYLITDICSLLCYKKVQL